MSKTLAELNAIAADEIAYQKDHERRYKADLARAQRGTPKEKKEAAEAWLDAITHRPEIVAERIDWLFNGSYGQGACRTVWALLDTKSLIIHLLLPVIAGLEWMVPTELSTEAIGKLEQAQLVALHNAVQTVLDRNRAKPIDERPV